jgi:hypothetical protein
MIASTYVVSKPSPFVVNRKGHIGRVESISMAAWNGEKLVGTSSLRYPFENQ